MKWKNLEKNTMIFIITNALFLLCGVHTLSKLSLKATIISMLLSTILSYFLLSYFLYSNKEKTLSLSKISKVSSIIIIPIFFLLLHFSLQRTLSFLNYNVINTSSYYLLIIAFLLTSGFAIKKGFTGIVRSSFIYLIIIILLTAITLVALFPKMDFQNVLPLVDSTPTNILKSMFLYIILTLFPYTYLFHLKTTLTKETIKSLKRGFLINQIFIISYTLIIFSILGIKITNLYPYPEVAIFKKVSFLNIIDRMESVFSISYFLSLFTYFVTTLYGLIKLIENFFNKKKEELILVIASMFLFFANEFYTSPIEILFISCSMILFFFILFAYKSKRN